MKVSRFSRLASFCTRQISQTLVLTSGFITPKLCVFRLVATGLWGNHVIAKLKVEKILTDYDWLATHQNICLDRIYGISL